MRRSPYTQRVTSGTRRRDALGLAFVGQFRHQCDPFAHWLKPLTPFLKLLYDGDRTSSAEVPLSRSV